MAKASAAGTWRGACRPEHYNLDYNRFNNVDDEGEASGNALSGDAFKDMLTNPNVPPQLKEAFRLSQVAKQTNDMAAQARADELVRAAILKGGPEIQKRFLLLVLNRQRLAYDVLRVPLHHRQPRSLS